MLYVDILTCDNRQLRDYWYIGFTNMPNQRNQRSAQRSAQRSVQHPVQRPSRRAALNPASRHLVRWNGKSQHLLFIQPWWSESFFGRFNASFKQLGIFLRAHITTCSRCYCSSLIFEMDTISGNTEQYIFMASMQLSGLNLFHYFPSSSQRTHRCIFAPTIELKKPAADCHF